MYQYPHKMYADHQTCILDRKANELLIEQDFAEAYTMICNNSVMSQYWSDEGLQILPKAIN